MYSDEGFYKAGFTIVKVVLLIVICFLIYDTCRLCFKTRTEASDEGAVTMETAEAEAPVSIDVETNNGIVAGNVDTMTVTNNYTTEEVVKATNPYTIIAVASVFGLFIIMVSAIIIVRMVLKAKSKESEVLVQQTCIQEV